MQTTIRKWGNSAGAIIPAAALAQAGLKLDDRVEIEVHDRQLVLKPARARRTMAELLAASPEEAFELDDEDRAWLNMAPVGQEIIRD